MKNILISVLLSLLAIHLFAQTHLIQKGYELVNDKEFEHLQLSSTERLGTDIIVAKAGVIEAAKKDFYAISDKTLKASFEKEKKRLQEKLEKSKLSEKQYQEQRNALQEQYDHQRKELDNLSEKFAKVNFDDVAKATHQFQLVSVYETLLKTYKGNKKDSTDLSKAYGSLAWYQLFAKPFSAAEASAKRGLTLDASQEWIHTNLAAALLYQGKWDAAKTIYLSLKDKPYGKKAIGDRLFHAFRSILF